MKKNILITILGLASLVCAFSSCSSEDGVTTGDNKTIAEKLKGKWMCTIVDDRRSVTNYNYVLTFVSPTKAYRSFSPSLNMGLEGLWENQAEYDVKIDGTVTLTGHNYPDLTTESVYQVVSINQTDMVLMAHHKIIYKGKQISVPEHKAEHFKKVTKDYSQDVIGTWEGKMTSLESVHDDGQVHRWEYKSDGTYVYYMPDGEGQWVKSDDVYADYFVDGVLLCCRWKNNGEGKEEQREWWEIESIQNGVMKWTAVRRRDDGSTYTASFQMVKVK